MHEHEDTTMLPYDKFYFNEKYYFSMFHEHKNTKLNHFSPISKVANFWVLQFSIKILHSLNTKNASDLCLKK